MLIKVIKGVVYRGVCTHKVGSMFECDSSEAARLESLGVCSIVKNEVKKEESKNEEPFETPKTKEVKQEPKKEQKGKKKK